MEPLYPTDAVLAYCADAPTIELKQGRHGRAALVSFTSDQSEWGRDSQ